MRLSLAKIGGLAFPALLLASAFALSVPNPGSAQGAAGSTDPVEAGRARFNVRCAGCHGQDGLGGERAPAIKSGSERTLDDQKTLRNLIQHGIPDRGMPAFTVPAPELSQLVAFVQSRVLPLSKTAVSGNAEAGAALFFGTAHCADCHMIWGKGSLNGPDLTEAARKLTLAQVETALLRPGVRPGNGYQVANVRLTNGQSVRGFVRNESDADLQMQSLDGRLVLLAKRDVSGIDRQATSPMPAWAGSPQAMRDLVKFLQRAPDQQQQANAFIKRVAASDW
jgi:putative heme-binding domain-containing protein